MTALQGEISMKGGESMKTFVAMMALIVGLSFGAATFVQADEKAMPATPPAAGKKDEKKADKKPETKTEKK